MFICFILHQKYLKGSHHFLCQKSILRTLWRTKMFSNLFVFLHPHTLMISFRISHSPIHLKPCNHKLYGKSPPSLSSDHFQEVFIKPPVEPFASHHCRKHTLRQVGYLIHHRGKRGATFWRKVWRENGGSKTLPMCPHYSMKTSLSSIRLSIQLTGIFSFHFYGTQSMLLS